MFDKLVRDLWRGARITLLITVVCGIVYPLVMTGIAQVAFHAGAFQRVELAVDARAQLFGFAVQPSAPLAPLRAIPQLARRHACGTAAESALQRAVAVADVADAAVHAGKRAACLAPINRPAARDQRIAFHVSAAAAVQIRALRHALRLRRQGPAETGEHHRG